MVFSHTYLLASFDSDDNHWVVSLCVGDDFKATSECRRNVNLQGKKWRREVERGEERRGEESREKRGREQREEGKRAERRGEESREERGREQREEGKRAERRGEGERRRREKEKEKKRTKRREGEIWLQIYSLEVSGQPHSLKGW